ncbi:hypothetical protein B9Q01_10520 [Candidatus Marsarchaeota G1 archaeon OSP_D]|jgi:hypothetical protein|uniref:Uncharacterized protein n=2 Tax=Candidatus Marsarchaeota group 1 TaxID=2203770 RepID=A0A2R6A5T1_9ARCH|nr:MAG: hypothetical protein B9Q01_10520 [Candidatus Marsarchaeota G1 archaeon OSP_D]PSN86115.1 MAG: hypothetical protein B9Q00_10580 [Candidatus Marsarchaeota G1 archaeon OSP_C]
MRLFGVMGIIFLIIVNVFFAPILMFALRSGNLLISSVAFVSYVVAIVSTVVFTIYFGNKSIREVSVMELIKAKSESNKTSNLPNGATKKESKE